VVWLNKGEAREPEFAVRYARHGAVGSAAEPLKFLGEEALWAFLALSLSIGSSHVQSALSDLHSKGSAEIASLNIPDDDLSRLKLV
jgi:hypothetical protein